MKRPLIILDRDGVINFDSPYYIKSPAEWHPIPGSLAAIAKLNKAGYQIAIVTNQSGVARGHYDLDTLHNIHEKLLSLLADAGGHIDAIIFCPHHPDENCPCRKPKPGMLHQVQETFGMDLTGLYFIGDSLVDMQAALTVGCKPLLVLTGNGEKTLKENPDLMATIPHFPDLAAAADYILAQS
jgi:D-glycero-D-manno-heptose 1,7-bisphosphate phosphatase